VGFVPVNGRFELVYMHRLILNAGPDQLVDHVNRNKLDNRRCNLRLATPQQNGQNKRVSPLSNTHLKGVGWHKRRRKYHARIQLQGMRCHLGFFQDAELAALVYDAAARTLFGDYALCNSIPTSGLHDVSAFWWLTGSSSAAGGGVKASLVREPFSSRSSVKDTGPTLPGCLGDYRALCLPR
jgi:hypothetical protein